MGKRKGLTKTTRFEVFKRDGFICQYCGRKTPEVVLEVDHIIPVAEDGDNSEGNLVTACRECNVGKGKRQLTSSPDKIKKQHAMAIELELQIAEYRKLQKSIRRRIKRDTGHVEKHFRSMFPEKAFTETFKTSIARFLKSLSADDICDCLTIAFGRISSKTDKVDPNQVLKYFCGVCWRTIKNDGGAKQ